MWYDDSGATEMIQMSDQRQPSSWHRNVRIAITGLLDRIEFLEDACGVSRKGMHNRLSQLEELMAGVKSGRPDAGGEDDIPKRVANSRGRISLGGVSGTLSGKSMTISEAQARAAELRTETHAAWAAQTGRRSSNVHQLRRAG